MSRILFTGGGSASVHAGIPHPLGPGTHCSRHPLEQTPPGPGTPQDQAPPLGTRHHPQEQTPPGADTPQSRHPPEQCMLGDTVNKRAVCILLECNLVTMLGDTVNKRAVCILLECNLVTMWFQKTVSEIVHTFIIICRIICLD